MGKATLRKRNRNEAKVNGARTAVADLGERRGHGHGNGPRFQKNIRPKNEAQGEFLAAIETATIVFAIGSAGTGKTWIAVAKAVEMFLSGHVDRIILVRPAVEAGTERLGFLPGDMQAKLDPYMRPLYDVLFERLGPSVVSAMISNGQIEISPLAFMRGRTFTRCAVVLDEGQNATRGLLKMALTRLGEGSKMIVTGDPDQSDLDPVDSGLLSVAADLDGTPGIETIRFGREHVVRSQIVAAVLERI